ncbi:MAG: hypothetical protein PHD97_13360 [Bacteroidales bacterium]|nr:hypothetical protein [Bacteroidales bacterium]
MENKNFNNKDYQCPICGASIAYNSAMCSVCKAGISWNDGKPLSAIKGKSAKTFWIITIVLLSLVAFGLLFYVLQ